MKLSGVLPRRAPCAAVVAAAAVAGCGWLAPPPPAPTPSPNDACRALNESLAAAVPPGESLAELQARGVRVQTPLSFPPGTSPRPAQPSGAVVQMLIGVDGSVVPGSPKIVKSVGEAQVASAMEAAALSMRFEFEGSVRPAAPIPVTTLYAACLRS